ncbi:MAG: hypothetical protein M3Q16_08080 [Pseudomonadota bacterium]|nr:hypothetical protein [Pseudomonadota bacterium]
MREKKAILRHLSQVANPALLVLLLSADVAFLLLHIFNKLSPMPNVLFDLSKDDGYSEMFQYIKEYWIAIVLFAMYWRTREGIYGTWALLFTYALCDDGLAIHERVGEVLVSQWNYAPALGLRAQDFGELTVSVVVGSAFLVLITYFYLRCSNNAKNVSKDLALLFGLLVFFGVFVDMVNSIVNGLTMVEEAGEMATMSMITVYVVRLLERQGHVTVSLWQLIKAALSRNTLLVAGYK